MSYQVWWLLDDGSQGAQTVATLAEARTLQAEKRLEIARGIWLGRRRGRLTFDRWAEEWWAVWSTDPDRSPTTLAATENRLRRHVRPWFGQRPLEAIQPTLVRQWQNQLAGQLGYESLMACRSTLFRYQAGRFGSGFRPRPKSDTGFREIPLALVVVEAIRRQLPAGTDPDDLVFTGPGGGNRVLAGTRTTLSRHGFRRVYRSAARRTGADLAHLQLRGPHDLRHTFSTSLEDAGIPARAIDELMGHEPSRHGELDGGSRIGARSTSAR